MNKEDLASKELYLTTSDNPFSPKDDWNNWLLYDISHKYNTCERLSRLASTSESLSDYENNEILLEAMQKLVDSVVIGKDGNVVQYKIVVGDSIFK